MSRGRTAPAPTRRRPRPTGAPWRAPRGRRPPRPGASDRETSRGLLPPRPVPPLSLLVRDPPAAAGDPPSRAAVYAAACGARGTLPRLFRDATRPWLSRWTAVDNRVTNV